MRRAWSGRAGRQRWQAWAAAGLGSALLLASCTGADEQSPETPTGESTDAAVPGPAAGEPVQDVWVYERVQTVAEDGALRDLTADIVTELTDGQLEAPVELREGVEFQVAPALNPVVQDAPGSTREDLEAVAGLVRTDVGEALQVVVTPTEERSVGGDDVLQLDLSFIDDLEPGDPLIVDFAFGQGLPAGDGSEADLEPLDQLHRRMTEERFQWFGVEADGERSAGLLTVFGDVPGQEPQATTEQVAGGQVAGGHGAGGQHGAAVVTAAHSAMAPMAGGGGGGGAGGVPLKAKPALNPLWDLARCKDAPLDCLSDYFDDMEAGFEESLDDIFGRNMGPKEPPPPPCSSGCAGGSGEPHMATFDGYDYDFQGAGEFVLARSEDLEVQVRTEPFRDRDRVSIITAAAIAVGDHRITVRSGREPRLHVDGEPVAAEQARAGVAAGDTEVRAYGSDLYVMSPAQQVTVNGAYGRGWLDVYVDIGPVGNGAWEGLLGNADGAVADEQEATAMARRYGQFADTWRIDDASSLFDYAPGESTETFTIRDFPREPVSVADLSADQLARATAVCEAAGIEDPYQRQACILDYGLTGEIGFVRSALFGARAAAAVELDAGTWSVTIPGTDGLGGQAQLDGAGHVVVPARSGDGGLLTALDLESGEEAWQAETTSSSCVATTPGGLVATLGAADDGEAALLVLDAEDGSTAGTLPVGFDSCEGMAGVDSTVVTRSGGTLLGIDVAAPELAFERSDLELTAGPVATEDGELWVVTGDDDAQVLQLDPANGTTLTQVPLEGDAVVGVPAPTPDGVLVRVAQEDGGVLARVDGDGVVWELDFPLTVDGEEFDRLPEGEISADHEQAALYLDGSTVGVLDLATGELTATARPSSFNNNDGRVHLQPGAVVVGPFGGDHWVEALPTDVGQQPVWTETLDDLEGVNDVKSIGPSTRRGQVVVQATSERGMVVALVGPRG